MPMWTDEEFEALEQDERNAIDDSIAVIWLLLDNLSDDITTKIREFYQKYGKDGVVTYAEARKWVSNDDHTRRLSALILAVASLLDTAVADITARFESMLTSIIDLEVDKFEVSVPIDSLLNADWGVDEAVWDERLAAHRDKWKNVLGNDLKQAMLKRTAVDDVLEEMKHRVLSMKKILQRLGYTEGTAVGSLARRRIFKELGVTKYRFYTREDERVCEICGSLHGLIFPISSYEIGVNASPIHPWCRCWEVPILE